MTSWRQRDTEKLERFGSFWKGLTLQKQWEKEISASFNDVLRILCKKGRTIHGNRRTVIAGVLRETRVKSVSPE